MPPVVVAAAVASLIGAINNNNLTPVPAALHCAARTAKRNQLAFCGAGTLGSAGSGSAAPLRCRNANPNVSPRRNLGPYLDRGAISRHLAVLFKIAGIQSSMRVGLLTFYSVADRGYAQAVVQRPRAHLATLGGAVHLFPGGFIKVRGIFTPLLRQT